MVPVDFTIGKSGDGRSRPAPAICPATHADLKEVARIFGHYVTHSVSTFEETPPGLADWQAKLNGVCARGLPFLVAKAGTEVLGFAYASPWRPKPAYRYAVEDTVYVAPARTGHGVGRALLRSLLDQCARAGIRQVIAVVVDPGDGASAALHRSLGFTVVGRLGGVGHKHDRWLDTVLMQRELAGPASGG
jgi:L-amino acid N-acyltransferase YncA